MGAGEKNQAYAAMTRRKGKFGKSDSWKKKRNMSKIQCYGCQEYEQYKRDCPKVKKDNKRGREEAHITKEPEEDEKKKSKKEEVRDLYY